MTKHLTRAQNIRKNRTEVRRIVADHREHTTGTKLVSEALSFVYDRIYYSQTLFDFREGRRDILALEAGKEGGSDLGRSWFYDLGYTFGCAFPDIPDTIKQSFMYGRRDGTIYLEVRHHLTTEEFARAELGKTPKRKTRSERIAYNLGLILGQKS